MSQYKTQETHTSFPADALVVLLVAKVSEKAFARQVPTAAPNGKLQKSAGEQEKKHHLCHRFGRMRSLVRMIPIR